MNTGISVSISATPSKPVANIADTGRASGDECQ
jgi:hypothetical protein